VSILAWVLEGCAIIIMLFAAFSAGGFIQREKLADEWERIEMEWEALNRKEQRLWRDTRSRKL
jgi:hypothetical protein